MKILHTSDWHIGRQLYGRRRDREMELFLNWLFETVKREQVEVLLIAGDIFDNSTPGNRAQAMYYGFLGRMASSGCRHIVIIAGNHDSPAFLSAPGKLLKALNVHVVGETFKERPEEEILVLDDASGKPGLIVCAVPYLRDRDIRGASEPGESIADKERKLLDGLAGHYAEVQKLALRKREEIGAAAPLVVMGHLFAAGGKCLEGDGVRDLYVGSLLHAPADIFEQDAAYVALGHLHAAQKVGGSEKIRYSGAPIPMSFNEAGKEKSVCLLEAGNGAARPIQLNIPIFQRLESLKGDMEQINRELARLAEEAGQKNDNPLEGDSIWLEIIYEGEEVPGDLRDMLEERIKDARLEILRIKNTRLAEKILGRHTEEETLDDLDVNEVFSRCLDAHEVPDEQRPHLWRVYNEAVAAMHEAGGED